MTPSRMIAGLDLSLPDLQNLRCARRHAINGVKVLVAIVAVRFGRRCASDCPGVRS